MSVRPCATAKLRRRELTSRSLRPLCISSVRPFSLMLPRTNKYSVDFHLFHLTFSPSFETWKLESKERKM